MKVFSKAALVTFLALALAGCAEGAASYKSGRRTDSDIQWLEQRRNLIACRDDQTDLGYGFGNRLYLKIPLRVEQSEQLDCKRLLQPPQTGPLTIYLPETIYHLIVDPQVLRLAQAGQWMNSNQQVHECIQRFKTFEPGPPWEFALRRARELHPSESEVAVLVLNCGEDHFFFVIPNKVPLGTVACGQTDIPSCDTALH